MEDRASEIDTKLKMSKREFRGEGQYIDELFKWENLIHMDLN